MSGFNNFASGATGGTAWLGTDLAVNGMLSGFSNTGVTGAFGPLPSGIFSGLGSGWFNNNTGFSGIFDIDKLATG